MAATDPHPYFPPAAIIPGFAPNESSLTRLLPLFGCTVAAVVAAAYCLALRSRSRLRPVDRFAAAWFALCESLRLHQGYYIYNRTSVAGLQDPFAQLWKEYALSDSRYLTSDIFTVCVETITVFVWGPLCALTVLAVVRGSPTRHVSQVVVCTAHLYGVALYYATNWTEHRFTGVAYSRPEFRYFWVYYVGFNLPWVIVPLGGHGIRGLAGEAGSAQEELRLPSDGAPSMPSMPSMLASSHLQTEPGFSKACTAQGWRYPRANDTDRAGTAPIPA
ncbi:3-beta-hydroxysteroid-Delta(8), Delta(7)-isomerase [Tolypocladium capitatum]|uniref:3-beta-hydroxysteroid-Delta(8), Delta(7)-isomerase n=1 Tax=Tolypocladium capitatum TaxID=45235 RepID=A0A2K3QHT0_9HYPO|nr:3-beta-hydroxysteroid-Delta(8), Delta(7)-isomerase [Tolypocladium capitatum]